MLKGKNVVNQRLSTWKKINNIKAYNFTAEKKNANILVKRK